MTSIKLVLREPAWPDLAEVVAKEKLVTHVSGISMTCLEGGMSSGKPSATIRVDLQDGQVVLVQTSLALLLTACDGLKAKYGDPR